MTVFHYKMEPFSCQRTFIDEHADDEAYALWWEQGVGKSKGLIDNAGVLWCDNKIGGLFLLAPNGLHRNFITKELPKHLPDDIAEQTRSLFWHQGKSKTKTWQAGARAFMDWRGGLRILTMSYDGIMTDMGRTLAKEFLQSTTCLYGADESQRIKTPGIPRTTRVLASGPYAKFRRIMTGTPVANAPWDVYTQLKFIKSDFWIPHGLDSPQAMRTQFGVWDTMTRQVTPSQAKWPSGALKHGYKLVGEGEDQRAFLEIPKLRYNADGAPQYKNLDKLREILRPWRSRVLKTEVMDIPPKLYSPLEFDMCPAQWKAYEAIQKLGFYEIDGGRAMSPNLALTVLLRLQQIACGYLVADLRPGDDEPEVMPITPNPRLDAMLEITEDLPHQGIIWARFRSDIDAICAGLAKQGRTFARYDGTLDDDVCADNEDRFHRGDAQFFVATQSKGGEGLTLVEAKTVIYYSNTFKLIERLQSEDRPHRYGQTNQVNYIDLIARGTIDERLINVLCAKIDVASAVQGDGFKEWLRINGRLL